MSCLYILEMNPLTVASFANIFFHSKGCLFVLFMVYFAVQKLLNLIRSLHCAKAFKFNWVPFVYFCFYFYYSGRWVIEDLAVICVREVFCLCFPLGVL